MNQIPNMKGFKKCVQAGVTFGGSDGRELHVTSCLWQHLLNQRQIFGTGILDGKVGFFHALWFGVEVVDATDADAVAGETALLQHFCDDSGEGSWENNQRHRHRGSKAAHQCL